MIASCAAAADWPCKVVTAGSMSGVMVCSGQGCRAGTHMRHLANGFRDLNKTKRRSCMPFFLPNGPNDTNWHVRSYQP